MPTYSLLMTKAEIKSAYLRGSTVTAISSVCGCSPRNITYLLRRMNVEIRDPASRSRKYSLNENAFADIDSFESAYFLGLLMADGYNNESKGEVTLRLAEKDSQLIQDFRKFLGTNKPVQSVKARGQLSISIQSRQISSNLAKLGCVQRKTHLCVYPAIKSQYDSSFCLGYFDGDGGVTQSKSTLSNVGFNLTGNHPLIEEIQSILIRNCSVKKTKLDVRNNQAQNIVTLRYSGGNNLKRIHSYLYKNAECLGLERKKKKFHDAIHLR